jgi:hypothetical protein
MPEPAGCVFCQQLPGSNYQQPRAVVTQALADDRKLVIKVRLDWGSWPTRREGGQLAPGSLYAAEHPHAEVVQLHQLLKAEGNILTFQTIAESQSLPTVGDRFVYGVWWIPDVAALVEVPGLWRRAIVTRHDHCSLCWSDLDGTEAHAADNSSDDWACASCYAKFIEHGPPWAPRP